jgi:hypothetical protein
LNGRHKIISHGRDHHGGIETRQSSRGPLIPDIGSVTDPLDPPMWVIRVRGHPSLPRVLYGPGQGVVGDLLPALLREQQVGVAGVLLDLGDGVGLVMLGVGPLDAGGLR